MVKVASPQLGAWRRRANDVRSEPIGTRNLKARTWAVLAVLCYCLIAAPSVWAKPKLAFKGIRYAKVSRVCRAPRPGNATCFALARVRVPSAAAGEVGVRPYTAGDGALESGPAGGLTPADLASAYGYGPTAGGSGQTVALVDAYDDPSIESDLAAFDTEYGIASCTKANGCFTKVSQSGSTTALPAADTTGWSVEISLDVEMAHSVCPKCKILLVEAESPSFKNLSTAVSEAASLGATEISNSYGGPEGELGATEKAAYDHPGVVIAAATGDEGYDDWTELNEGFEPPGRPNMPASFPSVVAVGGTTLYLTEDGKRESETVWNGNGPLDESVYDEGASGGGCSALFAAEPWQQDVPGFTATGCGGKRLTADVSADANPSTGFDIYDSYDCGETCEEFRQGEDWLTIGGTSLATPLISSLYALAGGSNGVSNPSLTLYGHLGEPSSLYDVTEGGNGFCDEEGLACGANEVFGVRVDCEGTTACNAAPGFDGPSGVGTPNGLGLFKPLLPGAVITLPSSPKAGIAANFGGGASSDPYPGGSISSYSWSWGDGTPTSSGASPTHTFAEPGIYTVSLTVTDIYGLTSTSTNESVDVGEKPQEEVAAPPTANKVHEEEAEAAAVRKRQEEEAAKSGVLGSKEGSPNATIASASLQASASGEVTVKVSCLAGVSSCAGTVTLRTLDAVVAAAKAKPAILTLATGAFTVAGGQVKTIVLHLSSKARGLLARSHTLHVRVTIAAHNATGATHTGSVVGTLRGAKAKHGKG